MRLSELMAELEELAEEFGDEDPEVLFAYQPNYPLQDEIGRVAAFRPDPTSRQPEPVAYIVTAGQCYEMPYAPAEVFGG